MSPLRKSAAWFRQLLEVESEEERTTLVDQLARFDDPCVAQPLWQVLVDRTAEGSVRNAASRVLGRISNARELSDDEIRRCWAEGDTVLQRHVLSAMRAPQRTIVASVLDQPDHVLYIDAVEALSFDFDSPWAAERLVQALSHARASVRAAAADAVLWMEPVCAVAGLIAATRQWR